LKKIGFIEEATSLATTKNQPVPNFTPTEEVKSSAFSVLASPKSPK
jgi:hypothetical protein